jgi:putative heme-binding domain-containing protein
VRQALRGYPEPVRRRAEPLLKRLDVDAGKQKARLAELQPVLRGGDVRRGQEVFFGKKAACATCHTIQGDWKNEAWRKSSSARIGPELSKIGSIRSGQDLLEAIVFPSASLVRGYEPYTVYTSDGRAHNGIIARQTTDALYLVTAERAEIHIPRSEMESLVPGKVSIMPQGLDVQLSRPELTDLLAYLQTLR